MDIPCAPILADITVNGRTIKAVAQPTKQGWVYVFDRVTGQPVWPIEERPVEKGDVPGEWYSPTQPFVTKPPPFDRQGVSVRRSDRLHAGAARRSAEDRRELQDRSDLHAAGRQQVAGPLGTLMLPVVDRRRELAGRLARSGDEHLLHLLEHRGDASLGLVPAASAPTWTTSGARRGSEARRRRRRSRTARRRRGARRGAGGGGGRRAAVAEGGGGLTVQGLPLVKPPYGRITAIDLNKGELVWQIAHGETPDNIKNHPALKGVTIPRTGRQGRIGVLVTKTLVIAGEGGFFTTRRTASAARCCAPTTRRPARKSARSTCRRRRPARR